MAASSSSQILTSQIDWAMGNALYVDAGGRRIYIAGLKPTKRRNCKEIIEEHHSLL